MIAPFNWRGSNFQSTADINTNGIQIADVYFPYTDADKEKYVSDEYLETRTKLNNVTFKSLEEDNYKSIYDGSQTTIVTFKPTYQPLVSCSFKLSESIARVFKFNNSFIVPFGIDIQSSSYYLSATLYIGAADSNSGYLKSFTTEYPTIIKIGDVNYVCFKFNNTSINTNIDITIVIECEITEGSIEISSKWSELKSGKLAYNIYRESNSEIQYL